MRASARAATAALVLVHTVCAHAMRAVRRVAAGVVLASVCGVYVYLYPNEIWFLLRIWGFARALAAL